VQTCIIHLIRNTFRLASRRDHDALKRDIKPVYTAVSADAAAVSADEGRLAAAYCLGELAEGVPYRGIGVEPEAGEGPPVHHCPACVGQLVALRAGRAEQPRRCDAAEHAPQDLGVGAAPSGELAGGQRAAGQLLEGASSSRRTPAPDSTLITSSTPAQVPPR